jgi:hypothetical protein
VSPVPSRAVPENYEILRAASRHDEVKAPVAVEIRHLQIFRRDERGNQTNELEAYVLAQSLSVRSGNLELLRATSIEVTGALVKQGFEVNSGTPSFTVSTIEQTKLDLLEKATANAYERAQTLARGSGSGVGSLVSASQGVYQIVARGATGSSDYGEFDTDSILKTARVVVTLEYGVR